MKVKDIMTKDPALCTADSTLTEVARMMSDRDCGEIPVVENHGSMKPIGVVTDRDITIRTIARGRNPLDMTAGDVMSSPAVTVRPDDDIKDCCRTLEDHQLRRMPVVDDQGLCCGMISQADIAQHADPKVTAEVVRSVSLPAHA